MPENDADADATDDDADAPTGSSVGQFDDGAGGLFDQRFEDGDDEKEAADSQDHHEPEPEPDANAEADDETVDAAGQPATSAPEPDSGAEAEPRDGDGVMPGASVDELLASGKDSEALLAAAMAMDEMAVDAVRDRPQVPAYVPAPLAAAHQRRFDEFNARRTMRAAPTVRKHAGFVEALLRYALDTATDEDLEAYLPPYALEDE